MAKQKRGSDNKPEVQESPRFGFVSFLAGGLAAFAIAQNWVAGYTPFYQLLFWMAGGITFGFGLTRIFPSLLPRMFQGVGYLAAFAGMMFVVLFVRDKEMPSLNGSLDTRVLSGHMSSTADDFESMADNSTEKAAEVIAELQEAVYRPYKVVAGTGGNSLTH